MKRATRHKSDPNHRDKVLRPNRESCDMCGTAFVSTDIIEGHHTFGTNWKKNCKSHKVIEIDLRMIKVHYKCHELAHSGKDTDYATIEVLRELIGDCGLSDALERAGYITREEEDAEQEL